MGTYDHTATLLPDGTVLVVGGFNGNTLAEAELYNPTAGSWSLTGSIATGRYHDTASLFASGQVLVVGGEDAEADDLSSAELYDSVTGIGRPPAACTPRANTIRQTTSRMGKSSLPAA